MIFINIGAIAAFAMLMMMVGCLHGDFGSHTISGSPALDSASMGWRNHWTHVVFWYFPWAELTCAVLAAVSLVAWKATEPSIDPNISGK
jgi:hypothetical protein